MAYYRKKGRYKFKDGPKKLTFKLLDAVEAKVDRKARQIRKRIRR